MDATLFVHLAQLMDVIQKKLKLSVNSTAQKGGWKFWKKEVSTCHIFGGWNGGQ